VARDGGVGSHTLLVIVLVVAGRLLAIVFFTIGFVFFFTSLVLVDGVFGVGIFGVVMKVRI
jgi:flagellar basal body-associated protein FliL